MAYTSNDVQNALVALAEGDPESAGTGGSPDLQSWLALQQQYMSSISGLPAGVSGDSVVSETQQETADVRNLGEAKRQFTLAQAVANVQIGSDNFIRDSITAK